MNEYEALRREIEVRLMRETIYRAVDALNRKQSLSDEIKKNDEMIKKIGAFLLANGSAWEQRYQSPTTVEEPAPEPVKEGEPDAKEETQG